MNDREAFLILLSYLLPFSGLMQIFWGIDIGDSSKIIFGIVCLFIALFIMGYLIYSTKKEKSFLIYDERKINLLVGIFRHILASCALMIAEFIILRFLDIQIRHIIAIICISLAISTIFVTFIKKQ